MSKANQGYIIGVDGGGTKTVAALTNLKGKVLTKAETGSAHPRDIGVKKAVENVALAIKRVLPKEGKIFCTFLGLPAMEEEFKFKKAVIKKELSGHRKLSLVFKGKVIIGSDQLSGFRSGTDGKDGVILNAGSGSVAHGWQGKKEIITDSWGYLSEMGSAFWVGQRALQKTCKELDGRGEKTLITRLVFRKLRIKNKQKFVERIYLDNIQEIIRSFSILVDKAAKKGDKIAKDIMKEAGRELALSANTAIRKLNFQEFKFPLVLIGSMFKSKIVLDTVKREIKKNAPKVEFIRPKQEPVIGAVKLAIEALDNEGWLVR